MGSTQKKGGWLGKKKENTLEKFITLLVTIQLGKFSIEDKKILRVQKKNPLEKVLFEVFKSIGISIISLNRYQVNLLK